MCKIDFNEVDFDTRPGKKLQRGLLLLLKERAGMKYREIARLAEFAGRCMNSLASMYRHERKAMK